MILKQKSFFHNIAQLKLKASEFHSKASQDKITLSVHFKRPIANPESIFLKLYGAKMH